MIRACSKYLLQLARHKYWVFRYGRKLGLGVWQLFLHDWTKLLPTELPFRADWKFGAKRFPYETAFAVMKHRQRNPHHWEHWVQITGHAGFKDNEALDMPNQYLLEMCADWLAATKVYTGALPDSLEKWQWYQENFPAMNLSFATRAKVRVILQQFLEAGNVPVSQ